VRSPAARIAIGLATLAAVVILFIVFTGGDDNNDNTSSTTTTTAAQNGTTQTQTVAATQQIVISGGKPVGGIKKLDYNKGDQIKFIVTSDVADEIHVHGYDIKKDVAAGGSVRFSFPASIEGVFEAELEGRKEQIAQLKVSP
jgi:heme/copper-type cytochrome/quinol oxidase subunit 2